MKVFVVAILLVAAVMAALHLRMRLFLRKEPAKARTDADPTYWAILTSFSLFLAAMIAETYGHTTVPSGPTVWPGRVLVVASLVFTLWARRALGANYAPTAEHPSPGQTLVRTGPYRYLRHPIYVGNVMTVVGLLLAFELRCTWWTLPVFVAALVWRVRRENAFLRRRFGPETRTKSD